jgi:hypothetical protein
MTCMRRVSRPGFEASCLLCQNLRYWLASGFLPDHGQHGSYSGQVRFWEVTVASMRFCWSPSVRESHEARKPCAVLDFATRPFREIRQQRSLLCEHYTGV